MRLVMVLLLAASLIVVPAAAGRYKGRSCPRPTGHVVTDCRTARHGAPDLSRRAWRALYGAEVSVTKDVRSLARNPAAGNARDWPLVDSFGQRVGTLSSDGPGGFALSGTGVAAHPARAVRVRGRGCAASLRQQRQFPLVQVIAKRRPPGGTQAFIDGAALRNSASGRLALRAFQRQRGGGTGCGPARPERGRVRPLRNPNVGAFAHARLGNGELNSVDEYDAKPLYGNVVYFSSNTTEVHAGGIARGMVRVGTPVALVDAFSYCDPNSDGTLIWRYWSIRTRVRGHRRLYGWIPGRCPAALRPRVGVAW